MIVEEFEMNRKKKYMLLSNLVFLFETLPLSLLGLPLLTDLFMVKALCFNIVKEFIRSVWFDMITLLLKKLHASGNTNSGGGVES